MKDEQDRLINALDSVTWYNGLAEIIVKWKDESYFKVYGNTSMSLDWDIYDSYDIESKSQLQVIWMICVELFGDCGTSPRTGWIYIDNKGAFHRFIDDITETYRDSLND